MSRAEVARAAARFRGGELVRADRAAGGHIHDSWQCTLAEPGGSEHRMLLQRLNTTVFAAPHQVMDNVARVTAHLAKTSRAPALLRTASGHTHWIDEAGGWWRAFELMEPVATALRAETERHASETGRAFGRFHRAMLGFPAPRLHDTLPNFHDTPSRLVALRHVAREDPHGRAAAAGAEIDAVLARAAGAGLLQDLAAHGAVPERIAHNDAKIANVLFDAATGAALCVVDLDTVMPGLALHDFGDLIRSTAATAAEDDANRMEVSVPLFTAIATGFLAESGDAVTGAEREHLVDAARIITLEQAARFLTDHLGGDRYYRVDRAGHNLDRARAQLALLESLERRDAELRAVAG